jgi:hypothetical protein
MMKSTKERLLRIGLYGIVPTVYIAGFIAILFNNARLGVIFYGVPAAYGAFWAAMFLSREIREWRFLRAHPTMPTAMNLDVETGYATITQANGEMVSLEIPDDVLREGPLAVQTFVFEALDVSV